MPYFMSWLPHHPSLQRYTWRIGVVLTGLFMSELNETFSIGSKYIFKIIGVNFTGLRNQPVLQDSRMTLGGKMESWQGYSCQNWMKLSVEVLNTIFNNLLSTSMVHISLLYLWVNFFYKSKLASLSWANFDGIDIHHRSKLKLAGLELILMK